MVKCDTVQIKKNLSKCLVFGAVLVLFVFLRVYKIQSSLLFFNDMGRDFVELIDGWEAKKPPLLGPQTSAISFNQSATYYYLLFPLFLLTNKSGFASFDTALLVYVVTFGWLFWRYRQTDKSWWVILLVWLAAIQPELIRQNRFIWNPTFLFPFLSISLFVYLDLFKKFTKVNIELVTFFSALAVSFSYSAAPLVLAMALLSIVIWKRKSWLLWLGWAVSAVLINSPTIVFELVHRFALTKLFIHGQTNPQHRIALLAKIVDLFRLIVADQNIYLIAFFVMLITAGVFISWRWFKQHTLNNQSRDLIVLSWLAVISTLITLALPIQIEPHYIFGTMVILFMVIVSMFRPISIVMILLISTWFLMPAKVTKQWQPAPRTVAELDSCYARFCQTHSEPTYVSMQSGIIAYHNAPEHRFFMKKHGCQVEHIELNQDKANLMAAVADSDSYEQGKTAYNELTLFGPSEEIEVFECQSNLRIHVLKKESNNIIFLDSNKL